MPVSVSALADGEGDTSVIALGSAGAGVPLSPNKVFTMDATMKMAARMRMIEQKIKNRRKNELRLGGA